MWPGASGRREKHQQRVWTACHCVHNGFTSQRSQSKEAPGVLQLLLGPDLCMCAAETAWHNLDRRPEESSCAWALMLRVHHQLFALRVHLRHETCPRARVPHPPAAVQRTSSTAILGIDACNYALQARLRELLLASSEVARSVKGLHTLEASPLTYDATLSAWGRGWPADLLIMNNSEIPTASPARPFRSSASASARSCAASCESREQLPFRRKTTLIGSGLWQAIDVQGVPNLRSDLGAS